MKSNITILGTKFQNVEYIEGEDLNIENMKERIITKAWHDTERFKDVGDIAVGIGMGTRNVFFYARKLKLPNRRLLKNKI
jgi:hypothetical protein